MRHAIAIALLAAALLGVAACGSTAPVLPGAHPSLPLRVIAAENVWGNLAEQLGGTKAQVRSIVSNPNADPHDYEPTVADARDIASASMAIANGAGYDPWLGKLLAASANPNRVEVDAAAITQTPVGANPHIWYAPEDVRHVMQAIAEGYKKLDPADSAYFERRLASLETTGFAEYDAISSEIASRYAGEPIGASESVIVPLATSLHLNLVTPPGLLSAISEGVDPSAGDKATTDAQIRDHEIRAFVYNRQNATPDVQQFVAEARAAGIPVVTVTETLQPPGTTFQAWQTAQLTALAAALKQSTGR